ncbi:MAG TPA: NUDIX hydrolase N-terminal domain-containing protein [Leptolyngbyaceae cyanobacterium]
MQPKWLEWTQKLQAIAQNGLTYSKNSYDIERFQQLRAIAAEIMATYSNVVWTMDYGLITNNYV